MSRAHHPKRAAPPAWLAALPAWFMALAYAAGAAAPLPAWAQGADGKALFMKNCAACHQASGKGIPGAFPALAGNPLVQGAPGEPVAVLLQGRGGMPDFSGSLSDEEIASVLSYARGAWGNKAAPVGAEAVAALRGQLGAQRHASGQMSNKH
ncbi:c-type cytochrome [Pseudoduganella namucuonensis]|uniref:Cytochrome c, mono-and diheme variants n=1 Tax=Pseudoduganella namucuonensis TaxID=1035707 RepID=A0A1I7IJ80_9BURK|nr:cytochrome c [Pseudoduganella namucuonensis]SFU72959.1 Cytochrome c, mono-and diheme variants [Pseudoduganella namucuonensis]